nr:MAG TPA: hypothetical protein [Caudoviricetes sp.]
MEKKLLISCRQLFYFFKKSFKKVLTLHAMRGII